MKRPSETIIGVACLTLLVGFGCSDAGNSSQSSDPSSASEGAAPTLQETVTDMGDAAKKAINDAASTADKLIAKAQNLVSEKKFTEAADLVKQLANMELTPEQQKLVDSLKAAIQKALQSKAADEGTKAIGNLMGGQSE